MSDTNWENCPLCRLRDREIDARDAQLTAAHDRERVLKEGMREIGTQLVSALQWLSGESECTKLESALHWQHEAKCHLQTAAALVNKALAETEAGK